jgi:Ca2+-binding RTX toxin-like protein
MFGGSEDDVLIGGPGNDDMGHYCYEFIFDKGNDAFYGGSGNDDIIAFESGSKRDLVFCGPGIDTVYYQKGVDRLFDCERKNPL